MKLSRIDRIQRVLTVATLFPQLDAATVTSVSFALLAPRTDSPTSTTIWSSPYSVVAGNVTVLLAGPDADSTGAVVVAATADLWAKSTDAPETEAVKVSDRITVLGAGQLAGQIIASSQALIGLDTDGVPFYDPAGIGTPATISVDTDSVLYYTAP